MGNSERHTGPVFSPRGEPSRGTRCVTAHVRTWKWNYLLAGTGIALGLLSLWWPLIRSNGLMFYIGREWLEGFVPYRDLFDHKPPLIFAINALASLIFGSNQAAIHALELIFVIGMSQVVYALMRPTASADGLRGLCVFVMVLTYQTLHIGVGTAEIWCVGFTLIAWLCLRELSNARWAFFLGGLTFSLAVAAKPPAAMFGPALFMAACFRARGITRILSLGTSALVGALIPWAITFAYFVAVGAWDEFVDVFWNLNRFYMGSFGRPTGHGPRTTLKILAFFFEMLPLLLLVAISVAIAGWTHRRDPELRRTAAVLALLFVGAVAGTAWQRRVLSYHLALITPFFGVFFLFATRYSRLKPVVAALALLLAFSVTEGFERGFRITTATLRYIAEGDRQRFLATFKFHAHDVDRVGDWIKRNSDPSDSIAVRGYFPAIYIISGRRSATPFFWTYWLTRDDRNYRRDEFLEQDVSAMRNAPPAFVVVSAQSLDGTGPDSPAYFAQIGSYEEVFRSGDLIVLENRLASTYRQHSPLRSPDRPGQRSRLHHPSPSGRADIRGGVPGSTPRFRPTRTGTSKL